MVQIYHKKWRRGTFRSLFGYLRDWIVLTLPIKRLSPSWVKLLYGAEPYQFAFLVHPRSYQDVFISMPVASVLKFFLRRHEGYDFFSKASPFLLDKIKTEHNVNGYVIGQSTVPEIMFSKRKETVEMLKKSIRLASKICIPGAVIGLGGWFPMITKRGALLEDYSRKCGVTLTNGHCGTLASIFMSVEKIAKISKFPLDSLCVAVIGVGKMGTNVVRAFCGKVRKLILVDVNLGQLEKIRNEVADIRGDTQIESVLSGFENRPILRHALRECHIGICATSSYRNILKLKDFPENFIAIDDSRPEALPRDPKKERLILEGGLLKIQGAEKIYNYGFGEDNNFFGCLGEAFVLACNQGKDLKPTLSEVDPQNFENFIEYCKKIGVTAGDFKSGELEITDDDIKDAFLNRSFLAP